MGDHPRVRGEQLTKAREKDRRQGSPPRARGAERCQDALGVQDGITPACAGSSSTNKSSNPWKRDHPRVRGEQQPLHLLRVLQEGSPPRARGADSACSFICSSSRITPACAGSSHRNSENQGCSKDHPRVRGEQESGTAYATETGGSPPRARGAARCAGLRGLLAGITPACAGSSNSRAFR